MTSPFKPGDRVTSIFHPDMVREYGNLTGTVESSRSRYTNVILDRPPHVPLGSLYKGTEYRHEWLVLDEEDL